MDRLNASALYNNGRLIFKIDNDNQDYIIYYCENSDYNNLQALYSGNEPNLDVESPSENRLFFRIICDNNSFDFSTQYISNVNISNFRDIGGYQSKDGRKIRWGKLYRSAHLGNISTDDENFLINMGLKTVFDFRSAAEVKNMPDIVPIGVSYINCSGIVTMDSNNEMLEDEDTNLDMIGLVLKYSEDPKMLAELDKFLLNSYGVMVEHPDAFKNLFEKTKATPEDPLLFHCTAGKDRTGLAAALIMTMLDIPKDIIMHDYMLSNYYRQSETEAILTEVKEKYKNPNVTDIVARIITTSPHYLNHAFKTIDNLYGGTDIFFKNKLNLSDEDIQNLKNYYLE